MNWKRKYERLKKKHLKYKAEVREAVSMINGGSPFAVLLGREILGLEFPNSQVFTWHERTPIYRPPK